MAQTKNMITYIVKRLLLIIPTVLMVLLVTSILSTLMTQSVNLNQLGGGFVDWDIVEAEKERIGFYDPWYTKIYIYFRNFFSGDWGTSYLVVPNVTVTELIATIFPKTFEVVIIPIIIIPILSVKLGVISAKNMNNWKDALVRIFMMVGACIPVFWLTSIMQYFVSNVVYNFSMEALDFEILNPNSISVGGIYEPITGFRIIDAILTNNQFLLQDTLLHMYLPAFCLIIFSVAGITRQTRASMLEVMQKDYVRTARAKGVSDKDVINKHALRNALIPSSTAIVGTVAALLTGTLFVEMTFNYNGMGYYMIRAIMEGDYVIVNGILVINSIIILVGVLIADIIYTIIDPRITYT